MVLGKLELKLNTRKSPGSDSDREGGQGGPRKWVLLYISNKDTFFHDKVVLFVVLPLPLKVTQLQR